MIKSMTAFASGEADIGVATLTCELRSVNHRHGDITLKLPDRLRFCEPDLRTLLNERIKRGKIDCSVNYKRTAGAQSFNVDLDAVRALVDAANAIERLIPTPRHYSALEVLAFPGIQGEAELDKESLKAAAIQLLTSTLDDFIAMRGREGEQLQILIQERCVKAQALAAQAAVRMPVALQNQREKLQARIAELNAQPDHDRLEQELALLAQKWDVDEELDRLQTHIGEVLRCLELPDAVGRRLDFLMQEMHREANTLGSKSGDKEISQIAIELKVLIEQIREQVQNVE